MIILSGLLVVGAIALLVAGIVTQEQGVLGLTGLQLIYVSIAVSVVSALCLAIGVLIRRRELFGQGSAKPANKTRQPGKAARQAAARAPIAPVEEYEPSATLAEPPVAFPMPSAQVPDDALVYVVPGRKRYHLDTCRQLAGRQTEELTYVEAQEEGFSPCTACLPDTALAARAMAAPAGEADGSGNADSTETATEGLPVSITSPDWTQAEPVNEPVAGFTAAPVPDTVTDFPAQDYSTQDYSAPDYSAQDWNAPTAEPTDIPDWAKSPSTSETTRDWDKPYVPSPLDDPSFAVPAESESRSRSDEDVTQTDEVPASRSWDTPTSETRTDSPWKSEEKPGFVVPNLEQVIAEAIKEEAGEPAAGAAPTSEEPLPQPVVPVPESRPAEPAAGGPVVRILSGTKRYHRTDCALIEDIGDQDDDLETLPREEAKARGCTPCLVCQPDREHAV